MAAQSGPLDGEILGPDEKDEAKVRKNFWATVKRAARNIPFMEDVVAAYFCAMDPATPARVRGILIGALAYFVLPLDVVPDALLGIGFTDDAGVLTAAIAMVAAHITDAHRRAAKDALADDQLTTPGS